MSGHWHDFCLHSIQSAGPLAESLLKLEVTTLECEHVLKLVEIYSELFEVWVSKSLHLEQLF